MKKTIIIFLLVLIMVLPGCTVLKLGNQNSELKAIQELGLAYKEGDYTIKKAIVTGCIANNQSVIWLGIPVGKKLVDSQGITITSATGSYLRTTTGKYVLEQKADLTPYIDGASIQNDGAILFVSFKNPDKWLGSDGEVIPNNTPITGTIDIGFAISDALIQ